MSASDLFLWVGLGCLAYALLILLLPVLGSLQRAGVRRRYLASCERERLAGPSDDTVKRKAGEV